MPKFLVTITGADDNVAHEDLIGLSQDYPFVEWGILFSASQNKQPRYPSKNWRLAFYGAMNASVNISAHLCGSVVADRLDTCDSMHTEVEMFYPRVQFNRLDEYNVDRILHYSKVSGTNVIIPSNNKTKELASSFKEKGHISLLFDTSGGRGIYTFDKVWPDHNKDYFRCGYAGGISDVNIDSTMEALVKRYEEEPFWIDIESGARDDKNQFSLARVERILKRAKEYIEPKSPIILLN
jgi:hypothetical protein